MVKLAGCILANLENQGAQLAAGPSDGAVLFRIVGALVLIVRMFEYLTASSNPMALLRFLLGAALLAELNRKRIGYITVIPYELQRKTLGKN